MHTVAVYSRYINKVLEEGRPVSAKSVYPQNFGWTVNLGTERKQIQAGRAELSRNK